MSILRSTLKFLEKRGFSELTIESIAANANVGKATVYRWWPNKAALVADAFAHSAVDKLHFPDTGALITDMSQQMQQLVHILRSRRGRIVSALLGAGQSDPSLLTAFRERFMMPRRAEAHSTLKRAIDRGELRPDQNLNLLLDSLYGPIYMRFLLRHDPLTDEFVTDLCRQVLGSITAAVKAGE
ncbi:MAG TPA: TetR/AcrR family transcriptional regulator [Terriglobales bacterium]